MKKIIFLLFAFVMQTTLFAKSYFPEGTKWTEIRLDTLKYDEWYSKVEGKWVPNYEVIEYYVQGEYAEHRYQGQYENSNHIYSCVYSSGPGWADSLTFFVNKGWSEEFRPIAQFAGWNSLQRSIPTGVMADSNVSRHKLTFENCL